MQMESLFSSATTSITHVYGNVAKAMEAHIKSILPAGFIKDSSISTRVAFRHFQKRRRMGVKPYEIHRKDKPCLIIRPVLEMISPGDDIFLNGTHYTRDDGAILGTDNDIQEFLEDKTRGIGVGFRINRYRITYEFEIQLSTTYASYDLYHYLINTIPWGTPKYLNTPLESLIPKNIIATIARYIGLDTAKQESIPSILQYLRTRSSYPITYMMRSATSRDEYFLYYMQNIITTFSDLNVTEGDKRGHIEDTSLITFKANCDFNVIGNYFLYGKDRIRDKIQMCIHMEDQPLDSGAYVPIFTYNITNIDKDMLLHGYTEYSNGVIKTDEKNDGKDDTLNLRSLIGDDDYKVCLDYMANGNPIDLLFKVTLTKEMYDLDPSTDWEIDWNTLKVTIHNSDKFATYRLIIYCNLNYLNSKKLELNYESTNQQTTDSKTNHGYQI